MAQIVANYYVWRKNGQDLRAVDIDRMDGPDLDSGRGDRSVTLHTFPVSGKGEARRIAREHGAQPWNF